MVQLTGFYAKPWFRVMGFRVLRVSRDSRVEGFEDLGWGLGLEEFMI